MRHCVLPSELPNRLALDAQEGTTNDSNPEGDAPKADERFSELSSEPTEHEVKNETTQVPACTDDPHDLSIVGWVNERDDRKRGSTNMLDEEAEENHEDD